MSITIRSHEAQQLVAELTRSTGQGTTDLVLDLLRREKARREREVEDRVASGRDADRRLKETWDGLPIVDPRPFDEIVAYDDHGLPV